MLSIEDELAQADLCKAMRLGDGPGVARLSSDLVIGGRAVLVRRACLECASLCQPRHAEALVDVFVSRSKAGAAGRRELASLVATIMAGARDGYDAALPSGTCRAAVDGVLSMPGADKVMPNLSKLPARLGPTWLGVAAVARDAVRAGTPQEPLVHNAKLCSLFDGRDPRSDTREDENDIAGLKLCALWAYSRDAPLESTIARHGNSPARHTEAGTQNEAERVVACDAMPLTGNEVNCILDSR
jgi:hypothetical protein